MRENTGVEKKKNSQIDQTEHIPKEKRKEYNTGSFDINKRKTYNKRRADSKNGTIWD